MKRVITIISIFCALTSFCCADDNWVAIQYFQQGQKYFDNYQYSSAITEFKKALRTTPNGREQRVALINTYLARATYYNDKTQEYAKALDDLRSALFYIKYYDDSPLDGQMSEAATKAEHNIGVFMQQLNISTTPANRFRIAKQLRVAGNFSAAATEFQYAVLDPKFQKDSYISLGDISNVLNMDEMAVKYYTAALKFDDKNANVHLKLARAYDNLDKNQQATHEYNLALVYSDNSADILNSLEKVWLEKSEKYPNDAEIQSNLGAVYQKKGDFTAALTQYKRAESLNPANVNTKYNLGTLYQQQKNYQAALAAYDSVLRDYPQNAFAHYYKAQCLRDLGNKQEAISEYKIALTLTPNIGTAKSELFSLMKDSMTNEEILQYMYKTVQADPNNPDLYYEFALELHKANKLSDAVTFYKDTIKLDPKYSEAYLNLAQTYKQLSKFDDALATMEAAKKVLPNDNEITKYYNTLKAENVNIVYNDALKFFNEGNYTKAIEKYLTVQPETTEALIGLAACYQKMDNNKMAIQYYKKAFNLDQKNVEIASYIATLSYSIDNFPDTEVYAKKVLALEPTNQDAKELISLLNDEKLTKEIDKALELYDQKKYVEGISVINSVIVKDGKNANAYYYRAMFYDAQKKYDLALKDYQLAYQYDPEMIVAVYSQAVVYDNLDKYKEANQTFKKYLSLCTNENEYTEYVKQRLAELKAYD